MRPTSRPASLPDFRREETHVRARREQRVVDCHGVTDRGHVRPRNEDQFLIAHLAHAMHVQQANELVMLAGSPQAVSALQAGPDAEAAPQVNFTKGGKGLRLIWAAFVLQQHRVHTWTHPDHRDSVGFRFPVVSA